MHIPVGVDTQPLHIAAISRFRLCERLIIFSLRVWRVIPKWN